MYRTGKAQPMGDTIGKYWRRRMYGVNIVGVGLCRYWTPCCANRDVGCGYIESFDRKGLKLVGTLSGQSTVRPPPILGSCANESVEVQKSSARDVNNIRFSSQPPQMGTPRPRRSRWWHDTQPQDATPDQVCEVVLQWFGHPLGLNGDSASTISTNEHRHDGSLFSLTSFALPALYARPRCQQMLHYATLRGGLIQPRSMCHNCASGNFPSTHSLALIVQYSCPLMLHRRYEP